MIVICLAANVSLIAGEYFSYNQTQTALINQRLSNLAKSSSQEKLKVKIGEFGSTKLKLDKFKVNYVEAGANDIGCKRVLPENIMETC
jgi:hypothetical protein